MKSKLHGRVLKPPLMRFGSRQFMRLAIAVAAAWLAVPRAAQGASKDLKSASLEASRKRHSGKNPFLRIARPRGSQTHYEAISFAGATDVGASLTVNGEEVAVRGPNGAFAGLAALKPGENELVFLASNKYGKTSRTIGFKRIVADKPKPLVSTPLRIASDRSMSPLVEQVLADGDWLEVSFFGSPGHQASFRVAEPPAWLPMREAKTEGKPNGYYQGAYRISSEDSFQGAKVRFRLSPSEDAKGQEPAEKTAKGAISVLERGTLRIAEIRDDFVPLYTAPLGRARHGNAGPGTRLVVIGRIGRRYKVRLGETMSAWIDGSDCKLLPKGEPPPRAGVGSIGASDTAEGMDVSLGIGKGLPVIVYESLDPPRLTARIFGARAQTWWMESPGRDDSISSISWKQAESETLELQADINSFQPWGWDWQYRDDALHWIIKPPPRLDPKRGEPLHGLKIVIDAGHGGRDRGASGPTGMAESQINLAQARLLAGLLKKAGAEVTMTRDGDTYVGLTERVKIAHRAEGDLFVSMHNNSISDDVDPTLKRGTLVLYYHPQSKPLAEAVYQRLIAMPNEPQQRGIVHADIRVVRDQTQMPSILVEGLFLSNPRDEALLMSGKHLDSISEAVYKGIVDFLSPLRSPPGSS